MKGRNSRNTKNPKKNVADSIRFFCGSGYRSADLVLKIWIRIYLVYKLYTTF